MGQVFSGEKKSVVFPDFAPGVPRLDGKVVAITGCTSGTGLVAAKLSAEKGAHVFMLNRASERAKTALAVVQKVALDDAKVIAIDCDLSDFASVKKAAAEIQAAVSKIDVLANNAGIAASPDVATKDGFDIQMQTNHFSHFLLTRELLPLLEAAASEADGDARVVTHTSLSRNAMKGLEEKYLGKNGGQLGGDDWGSMWDGPRWERYQQSKLANMVFSSALDKRLRAAGSKVKAVAAAPGHTTTAMTDSLYRDHPSLLFKAAQPLFHVLHEQSAEDGTVPLLTAMYGAEVKSGDLWVPRDAEERKGPAVRKEVEAHCCSAEAEALLWGASEVAAGPFAL